MEPKVVSEAKTVDCASEGSLRTKETGDQISMQFENLTSSPRKVYWLNFDGNRTLYQTLGPGVNWEVSTYAEHLWVVTDSAERCQGIYFGEQDGVRVALR